jgi:hypothetical protein
MGAPEFAIHSGSQSKKTHQKPTGEWVLVGFLRYFWVLIQVNRQLRIEVKLR